MTYFVCLSQTLKKTKEAIQEAWRPGNEVSTAIVEATELFLVV